MLRSMYSGISGLRNFQTKLDVIGNNIANVNTFGYKKGRTTFKDLMSQQMQGASTPTANRGGTNPMQVGLGGAIATIDNIHTQGSMQTTGRSLDVGISGDGFFLVSDGNLNYYTRAGNFYLDVDGTLVNGDGLRVMGYRADAEGNIDASQLQTLQIQAGSTMAPSATDEASFKGNLNADFAVNTVGFTDQPTRKELLDQLYENNEQTGLITNFSVADSLGGLHTVELAYVKTGSNQWEVFQVTEDSTTPGAYTVASRGTLMFDGQGKFDETNTNISSTINITPTNGADPIPINLTNADFAKVTQYAGSTTIDVDKVNGNLDGYLESFNIGSSGEIVGVYSNGNVQLLGQIAVATFNNPGGLTKVANNTYQESNNSGTANVGVPGDGRGTLMGSALEMSNVDLSEEFTEMIVAQRGFQANTRIITTSDEVLQELVNLKR